MSGLTRRDLMRSSLAAVAVGALGGARLGTSPAFGKTTRKPVPPAPVPPAPTPAAGAAYRPYGADSFFQSRVTGAPIDSTLTGQFRSFMKSHPDQLGKPYPYINGITASNQWGTAYAEGSATDPIWRLTGTVPSAVSILGTRGFHAPEWFGSMLSGTSDSPFVCMDRGYGISVWAAKAKVVAPYTIEVGAAGYFAHASNGLDKRNPRSNSTENFRSRGCIPDAMVIRRDLMDTAIANGTGLGHVLHMFLVETSTAAGFRHPMIGTESGKYGWGAEGTRLAIASTVDLTKRGLSPAGLVVARTLQQHGCYLGDNSGSGTSLKAQQASATRDPWAGLNFTQKSLTGITWDDFIVLQ